jgi:hypothetical protein
MACFKLPNHLIPGKCPFIKKHIKNCAYLLNLFYEYEI